MNKKTYLWVLLIVGLLVASCGGFTLAQDSNGHFLWEISTVHTKAYILGSVHVFPEKIHQLDPVIEAAYQESDLLAVEVDITKVEPGEIQQFIFEKGTYAQGDGLKNHLSPSSYSEIQKLLNTKGIDIERLNSFRPWFIHMILLNVELQKAGLDLNNGIDRYFLDKAALDNKTIVEMESWDFQLNLLSSFDDSVQEKMLLDTVENLDNIAVNINKMVSAWRIGDTVAMEELVYLDQDPNMQVYFEKFFHERDRLMTAKIEAYIKSGKTYLVVVGSGHLVGSKGIISLLRQRGYTVRQL